MSELDSISLTLQPQEQEMIELLREEMNLPDREAVLRLLIRQAIQRVAITCPTCGHFARRTAEDEAECRSCLSVLTLSEGIWRASAST
ncbi:MAG: hypothetical protein RML36_08745 [Anaerolineae bacterium]|nr:hypothetical protein [Anaerolineae bacterium]MDW8099552.1 hypothetical protein [Anaerolineae bacterium]